MNIFRSQLLATVLIIVIVTASLSRLISFGSVPLSLYWDEIAMHVDAKSIMATGKDFHGAPWLQPIYPSYGDYKLATYIILSAPLTLLPLSVEAQIRLLNLVAFFVTGAALYLLSGVIARNVVSTNSRTIRILPLLVVCMYALSPWSFTFSRTGFEGFLAQAMVVLGVLMITYSRKKRLLAIIGMIIGCLSIFTYYSSLYVWPIVGFSSILYAHLGSAKNRLSNRMAAQIIGEIFLLLIAVVIAFSVISRSPHFEDMQRIRLSSSSIVDPVPFILTAAELRKTAGNNIVDRLLYTGKLYQGKAIAAHVEAFLSPDYLFFSGDPNMRHGTGQFGLFVWPMMLFLISGSFILWSKHWRTATFLFAWWLSALVPAVFPNEVPHALRSLNALAPLCILIGYGAYAMVSSTKKLVKYSGLGILLLSILVYCTFLLHYFIVYPKLSATSWQYGYADTARWIAQHRDVAPIIKIDHPDGQFFLWYLVYGDIADENVQSAVQKNYSVTDIGSVSFSNTGTSGLLTSGTLQIIGGPAATIRNALEQPGIDASKLGTIDGDTQTIPFSFYLVQPSKQYEDK